MRSDVWVGEAPEVRLSAQYFPAAYCSKARERYTQNPEEQSVWIFQITHDSGCKMNVDNTNNTGHATSAPLTPSAAPAGLPPAIAATNFETAGLPAPRVTGHLGLPSDDAMREVIRLVAPRDRLSMATALRRGGPAGLQGLNTALAQSLPGARRAVAAAAAEVPADIEEIASASVEAAVNDPNFDELQRRDEVIEALATRVRELPLRKRIGACEALGSGLMKDEEGYRLGIMKFRAVLRIQLHGAIMDPDFARLGFNMTEFVTFLESRDQGLINDLQMRAVAESTGPESVWAAANSGGSVAEIATKFGITHTPALRAIESAVVGSDHPDSARAAVIRGEPVEQVAARFNITDNELISRLEILQT
jgi:hypothetical protein